MITLLLLFNSTFLIFNSFGQNPATDSLIRLLHIATEDTVKLRLMVEISEVCDPTDILKYTIPAIQIADKLQQDKALPNTVRKTILKYKASASNNIGFVYSNEGKIKEALEYYAQSLKIQEEIGDKQGKANSFNNMASIYSDQGQVKEALDYLTRSLKIKEEINDKSGVAQCLNNIGILYDNKGQLDEAWKYYAQSLKLYQEINDKQGIAQLTKNMGVILRKQGKPTEALNYYNKSLLLYKEMDDKEGLANIYGYMSEIYFQQGAAVKNKADKNKVTELAFSYSSLSLSLAKEIGYAYPIRNAEEILAKIDSARGNMLGAYMHYKQFIAYRDKITNDENGKASMQKQMQYEYEKKALANKASQDKLDAINAEEKQKQQIIIYAVAGLLVLVGVFAVFMYNRFRITQKQKVVIEEQKVLVDKAYESLHEKNKEVMDSIHYAKRIQTALITSEKSIASSLNRLMKGN